MSTVAARVSASPPPRATFAYGDATALELVVGDITEEATDAVVVPAGGLVDLAIRRLAGPALPEAVRSAIATLHTPALKPGQAVMTSGFGLRTAHIIYCALPLYTADRTAARANLAQCYRAALGLARREGLVSIAFPALGAGVRGYPVRDAASVAIEVAATELRQYARPQLVRIVLLSPAMMDEFLRAAEGRG
jgi:O-acetyl-ADP-ribose deacetylase (regulator of RNase III)